MVLAKDEVVLKEWEYGSSKQGRDKQTFNLKVTNKRLINESSGTYGVEIIEVPLKRIKGCYVVSKRKSNFWIILSMCLVIGLFMRNWRKLNRSSLTIDLILGSAYQVVCGADTGFTGSKRTLQIKVKPNVAREIAENLTTYIQDAQSQAM